uniref:Uncharacterized protein n=1 Tax=Setaria italica TaxID=4555 RepID=K3Y3R0_SETIT
MATRPWRASSQLETARESRAATHAAQPLPQPHHTNLNFLRINKRKP